MGTTKAGTATRLKFEAELHARKLHEDPVGFVCLDHGADFGKSLAIGLVKLGWKTIKRRQACKVATFETWVTREGRCLHITSSVFMGEFTLVEGTKA